LNFFGVEIDLQNLGRVYPAVVIEYSGDIEEMSLEWGRMNSENSSVKVLNYRLRIGAEKIDFQSEDEVIVALTELHGLLQS
jgi:hypothetical protein